MERITRSDSHLHAARPATAHRGSEEYEHLTPGQCQQAQIGTRTRGKWPKRARVQEATRGNSKGLTFDNRGESARKSTRHVPIVFAGGVKEKVDKIRREIPDAFYTEWPYVVATLKKALSKPLVVPVRPMSYMERYAGSTLAKKLGFKSNSKTALLNAPEGFEDQLEELPDGAELTTKITTQIKMALWFVRSSQELQAEIDYLSARLPQGSSLWIVYPKQTSRFKVDFNQFDVRAQALAAGWVDYKICAVDLDWTGLKFARKKS